MHLDQLIDGAVDSGAGFASLVETLQWRAERHPERIACVFLADGETEEFSVTFAQLDRRARAIAAQLQECHGRGERALLFYPPGLDFLAAFCGCLYAGVIAVPAYPPRVVRSEDRSLPRLQGIVSDASPAFALTTSAISCGAGPFQQQHAEFRKMNWVATDSLEDGMAFAFQPTKTRPEQLCFLQYTSGSTTTPRGVMVTHANILHNERACQQAYSVNEQSIGVSWLPMHHDLGLISCLQVLYSGCRVVQMSPLMFLQKPLRWLSAISRYRATWSGGPNFAYDQCIRKINESQRETLDLSSWDVAFVGAEPVRAITMEQFRKHFAPAGFRPQSLCPGYGLAEATLMVSYSSNKKMPVITSVHKEALESGQVKVVSDEDKLGRQLVGCGNAMADQQTIIVDPELCVECSAGQEGEIWVSGPSVASGYWRKPEETARSFGAYIADSGRGPFLRTGDMGFFCDGELYITGRIKDQIIIDGRNHHPQDIELVVEQSHSAVRPGGCAAFSADLVSKERLIVVAEVARQLHPEMKKNVSDSIRQAVFEACEIAVYEVVLLQKSTIPRTSSGKLQRRSCRASYLAGLMDSERSFLHGA